MAWTDDIHGQPAVPRVVGADLSPYPYISGYGLAQRITAFALPAGAELTALGFRNRKGMDVLIATQRLGKPRSNFLWSLGLADTNVGTYWSPDAWSPTDCPGLFSRHPRPLRQCWECAAHGYHSALFQLPSITRCPWHGQRLTCTCPQCGRVQFGRFNEDDALGVCACGFSAMNTRTALAGMRTFPTNQCAPWAEDYLQWARGQREGRVLYVPESNQAWDLAYAALAAPPARLVARELTASREPPIPSVFEGIGADPNHDCLRGFSQLGGPQVLRLTPLSKGVIERLAAITDQAVAEVPKHEIEMVRGDARVRPFDSMSVPQAKDHTFLIGPYGLSESGHAWLSLAVVDKELTIACGNALLHFSEKLRTSLDLHLCLQATVASVLGAIDGRRHLVDAMMACVCRAYDQGLRTRLRQSGQEMKEAQGSTLEVPLIELHIRDGAIAKVQVAWAPSPSARRAPSVPSLRAIHETSPRSTPSSGQETDRDGV